MFDFIWGLVVGLFQVILFGGFFIFGIKYYEWYDDRLVAKKGGQWASSQKIVTVELIVPPNTPVPISEMETFFTDAHVISGNRSASEIYASGAGFFNMTFDLIGHDGKVQIYLTLEKARMELVLSFLNHHYPAIEAHECEHPFKKWPQEWWMEDGVFGLKTLRGADFVPLKSDLFPLKSWKKFYNSNGILVNDPMNMLYNTLKSMPSDGYLIMQYIFRPHPQVQVSRTKGWNSELQKLRKNFLTNSFVDKTSMSLQALTKEEEEILQGVQVKLNSTQYRVKFRWMVAYDKQSKTVDDGNVRKGIGAYLQELSTSMQGLKDSGDTSTEKKYDGGKFGPFDGMMGNWLNKKYWDGSEKYYRLRRLYSAVVGQSLDTGESSSNFFLDPGSCASLFHFPQDKEAYNNTQTTQTTQNADGKVVIQQYQPAFYIRQPDGTQVPVMNGSGQALPGNYVRDPNTGEILSLGALPASNQNEELKHTPPEDLPT